ncbi:glycosyltransferase involved in cell wall biosynthesis [Sphaerotilus hippei]|uniref:Glycosyltransferase involved in cell wall biosynthesis n=1 Tax=Sphaerotilus hippei TaxID=744406 RepID=A0A318GXM2_9BURK|nr:glycosyltransferase [Sphaerotilus hippei]PXW93239.1 glycosyltransferase involved in cell wall biosynthesis [Sphaerotilus hippei]
MQIAIFHNIMWSKYKGGVFSAIHDLTQGSGTQVSFTQIAETEGERVALGGVDLNYHRYPYELIFPGSYTSVPTYQRTAALVARAWKTQADVVVLAGFERIEYWAMLATLMVRRKPRAVFCDSTAYDRPSRLLKALAKRLFFSQCDGFFGYGIRSREYLMQHGVPSEKIYFRCQAAALSLDYDESTALARRLEAAPKEGEAPRFVYVGRLSPEKGLDTLIQAMASVVKVHPRAQLNIIGGGPTRDALLQQVAQAGLQDNIHLPGSMGIDKLAEQYASATAMVLPSTSEPWGLVVNEALSHGCPSIVSNICGCVPELVVAAQTGFVFQANSAIDLAEKMLAAPGAFSHTENTARRCIEHMRQFSPANAARQIVEGCQAILKRNQRPA